MEDFFRSHQHPQADNPKPVTNSFRRLDGCTSADVVYLSEQNGNFATEFANVKDDVPAR
jgi:hypothetical protein